MKNGRMIEVDTPITELANLITKSEYTFFGLTRLGQEVIVNVEEISTVE